MTQKLISFFFLFLIDRNIHLLCGDVDGLVADLTEKMKYVSMGDDEDVSDICTLCQQWEVKVSNINYIMPAVRG